jgi:hypothetical protein
MGLPTNVCPAVGVWLVTDILLRRSIRSVIPTRRSFFSKVQLNFNHSENDLQYLLKESSAAGFRV